MEIHSMQDVHSIKWYTYINKWNVSQSIYIQGLCQFFSYFSCYMIVFNRLHL